MYGSFGVTAPLVTASILPALSIPSEKPHCGSRRFPSRPQLRLAVLASRGRGPGSAPAHAAAVVMNSLRVLIVQPVYQMYSEVDKMNRRYFVSTLCAAATGSLSAAPEKLPPVRAITRGPKFHWFGYYDKLQFDPASRYALGMEGSFEHRMPAADDTVRLGMVDTADGDRWIDLGVSHSW